MLPDVNALREEIASLSKFILTRGSVNFDIAMTVTKLWVTLGGSGFRDQLQTSWMKLVCRVDIFWCCQPPCNQCKCKSRSLQSFQGPIWTPMVGIQLKLWYHISRFENVNCSTVRSRVVGHDNTIKVKATGTCDKIATESNVDAVSLEEYLCFTYFCCPYRTGWEEAPPPNSISMCWMTQITKELFVKSLKEHRNCEFDPSLRKNSN